MSDEREPLGGETEETEDVEGHGLVAGPGPMEPLTGRTDEEDDDVEAHGLANSPGPMSPSGQ